MKHFLHLALASAGLALAAQATAQITAYEREEYRGRSVTVAQEVEDLRHAGFSDRAASVVLKGNRSDRWELCDAPRFRGRCVVLLSGQYASLAMLGLDEGASSVRAVGPRTGPDLAPAPAATSQIDIYDGESFRGTSFSAVESVSDLRRRGFNDRAVSAVVTGGRWEVCADANFGEPCTMLAPGQYPSLRSMGLNHRVSSIRAVGRLETVDEPRPAPRPSATASPGRIVFYENEGFQGRNMVAHGPVDDFRRAGFNDRASSIVVSDGRWEACRDADFGGPCVVLRPGQYASLAAMGMNDRISSVRAVERGVPVDDRRYAPLPMVSRDYGRREHERLYQADVTSVRAVLEDAGERCWVEPQQVSSKRGSGANVPGALIGAVIGGILGHQVGGGTGKDVATGIGVIAGAAIGGNSGRGDASQRVVTTQDVQRCSRDPNQAHPAYWDVTYVFRRKEYRVQMTQAPGRTITVNEEGEPRG